MADTEKNWYLILELRFAPDPVTDEAEIRKKIEQKTKFWTRSHDMEREDEYKTNLEACKNVDDILALFRDPVKRAKMVDDAMTRCAPIDKILSAMRRKEISFETIKKLSKTYKVDIPIVEMRMEALGIKKEEEDASKKTYEEHYGEKGKPQNTDSYKNLETLLKSFNVDNYYDFLALGTNQKKDDMQKLPCETLRQIAKEKQEKEYNKHDEVSSSGSKICTSCISKAFVDDSSKQMYDKYLEYCEGNSILGELKSMHDILGEISPDVYEEAAAKLTKLMKSEKDPRGEAQKVIAGYCKEKKISLGKKEAETENPNLKICRCGVANDVSDGRKVCRVCGLPLEIKCPQCGTVNDAIINVCKCGFRFENIDKSEALCSLTEEALNNMEFDIAEIHLRDAERYWKGSPRVEELKKRIGEQKQRVGTAVESMKQACGDKKYYEAKKLLENIKKIAPTYSDTALEDEINTAVAEAESFKKTAQTSQDENEVVKACVSAYERCSDCPGIKEIIVKYPPAAPTQINISCGAKANAVSWQANSTGGLVYYNVVRKEAAKPSGVNDGTLVGRVSMCSVSDNGIMPGVQYYYAVFAERAGIYSAPLVCSEPVTNLFEISGVRTASGDGTVKFTWEPVADCARVVVERIEDNGSVTDCRCESRKDFTDRNLVNDRQYNYHLYLEYTIGINKVRTVGVKVLAEPTRPPFPIEKLSVKQGENEDEFMLEWENPERLDVRFFYSDKKPDYVYGDIVPLTELEASMSSLMVNRTSETSGNFRLEGESLIYIIAAVVKSGSAVIGTIARTSKGGAVRITDVNLINGKIMINANMPKDATGFVVLYRHDQFADDISDRDTVRKYIPMKQFQYDGGLVIDSNEPKEYYITVYAEFRIDGECDYSSGSEYLFSNSAKQVVTYSVAVSRKLFGAGTINVTFEGDSKTLSLPDIDLMSAVGRTPMFKNSENVFYSIPAGKSDSGTIHVSIPLDKGIARDTYIKPFLHDDNLAGRYVFKLKLGTEAKIS